MPQVVKKFLRRPAAGPFSEPVPGDVPGYHDVIEHPMDLGTVAANLHDGSYSSLGAQDSPSAAACLFRPGLINPVKQNADSLRLQTEVMTEVHKLSFKKRQHVSNGVDGLPLKC